MELSTLGEFTISYKFKSNLKNRPQIKTSADAYEVFKHVFEKDKIGLQEQFVVLYLNNSNTVIGCCNIFKGALTSTVVDIRMILASALKIMATSIIISHNHPSGNMIASKKDIELTIKLNNALKQIDISLLDHVIVSPFNEYISLKDNGIF
ncbi:RadC family protein [Flavobacterium sp.]|jgi:DNA repair protein RadC|uniref:RadC family protein n=1 Tax=Flavobacterium sp. TaxID=239 RepID=UPI0037BEF81A